jgi:CRP-like cAMP-binding protein
MIEQTDTLQHSPLKTALKKLVPVNVLPPEKFDEFANQLQLETAPPGSVLFWHGDTDNRVVYLLSGEISLKDENNKILYRVRGGSERSRYPLAHELPREATAVAETEVAYVHIDMHELDSLMSGDYSVDYQLAGIQVSDIDNEDSSDWHTFVLQSGIFGTLSPVALQKLLMHFTPVRVRAGDVVIRQGEVANYYYFLREGRCRVSRFIPSRKEQIALAELGPGDAFGEEALILHTLRNATVTMLTEGLVLRLASTDFRELLEKPLLHLLSDKEAHSLVEQGAVWLDVRSTRDFAREHIPDSINLPYHSIRKTMHGLDRDKRYIVRSTTGKEAAVTAFLMRQRGFNASALHPAQKQSVTDIADAMTSEHVHPDVEEQADAGMKAAATAVSSVAAAPPADEIKQLQQEYEVLKQQVQDEVERRRQAEQEAVELRKSVDEARKAAESEMIRIAGERMKIKQIQQQSLAQIRNEQRSLRERTEDEINRLKAEAEQARMQAEHEAVRLKEQTQDVLDQASRQRSTDTAQQDAARQQRNNLEQELSQIMEQREAAQRELDELHQRVELEATRLDNEVEAVQALEHTKLDTENELKRLQQEAEEARLVAQKQAAQLAEQELALQKLQDSREAALNAVAELEARQLELENVQHNHGEVSAELQQLREEVMQARQQADSYRQQVEKETRHLATLQQQQAELQVMEQERSVVAKEIEHLHKLADEARQEATSAQLRMENLLEQLDTENREVHDLENTKQQLLKDLRELQEQRDIARARARQAEARHDAHSRLEVELGNLQAREEAAKLKAEAEQLRLQAEEEAIITRTEAEQLRLKAREELSRARSEAEQLRLQTEEELARLRSEARALRAQMGADLNYEDEEEPGLTVKGGDQ